ncbi:unnamed protein product [Oppiella nova]|uniref:Uncharacterized protein n=1 Tax=Oppiella nova TaxID=334625 RepID=A0A7R9QE31_9ACAR|nr:unnamed protein product [Oppiella nova]CAG2163953.1 unnamed protein product [Oppiella nova]
MDRLRSVSKTKDCCSCLSLNDQTISLFTVQTHRCKDCLQNMNSIMEEIGGVVHKFIPYY